MKTKVQKVKFESGEGAQVMGKVTALIKKTKRQTFFKKVKMYENIFTLLNKLHKREKRKSDLSEPT